MDLNRQNITSFWIDARWFRKIEIDENSNDYAGEKLWETQASPLAEEALKQQDNLFSEESTTVILLIPLLLLCMGLISKISFQKLNKERLKVFKHNPKIACRQCHFFSENHYLKCAVHPDTVLTKEAKDCSDYREKESS